MRRHSISLRRALALFGALAVAALAVGAGPLHAGARRPNLVVIYIDDLRWDALGCTGHPFARTPNIDRLAREGAICRNAFVTTPLCSPSRASLLTGLYARAHGVRGNGPAYNALSHQLPTFPRHLRAAGYETAYIGKWHMGNDPSPRPGFDRWVSFAGQGAHFDVRLNVDGQPQQAQGYTADVLTDYAVEFLRQRRDRPFFLFLSHKAVHGPFTPAPRHQNEFADQPIVRGPGAQDPLDGKPALRRPVGDLPPLGPGTGSGDGLIRNQLRMLLAVDESVGRVLAALAEQGELDRTVVLFTSDNGYFWGEHGLGDKRWAYEESIRVPLLIRYPRLVRPGTVIEEMVLNVDLAPTLLELAGARPEPPPTFHGRSLLPLFGTQRREWRQAALFEYFQETNYPRAPTWQAVRTPRWKYIHYPELEGMDELYDLAADPHELRNRIADPAAQEALAQLQRERERLLRETVPPGP